MHTDTHTHTYIYIYIYIYIYMNTSRFKISELCVYYFFFFKKSIVTPKTAKINVLIGVTRIIPGSRVLDL
jgi:hypothetical protein